MQMNASTVMHNEKRERSRREHKEAVTFCEWNFCASTNLFMHGNYQNIKNRRDS